MQPDKLWLLRPAGSLHSAVAWRTKQEDLCRTYGWGLRHKQTPRAAAQFQQRDFVSPADRSGAATTRACHDGSCDGFVVRVASETENRLSHRPYAPPERPQKLKNEKRPN